MACCVLTAYFMSKLIRACEFLDLDIIKIQYNEFDSGPEDVEIHSNECIVTTKIVVEGMTCAACVSSIEYAVYTLEGVDRVSVSLHLSRATVVHNVKVFADDIITVIESRGYGAIAGERSAKQTLELLERNVEIQEARRAFTNAAILSSIISGFESLEWVGLPSLGVYFIRPVSAALAIWIQIFDAKLIHSNAWRGVLARSLSMDTLVSLSLALGIALSLFNVVIFGTSNSRVYWSSVSFLTTVVVGGRLLDLILRKQSSTTFAKLYGLQQESSIVKLRKRDQEGRLEVQCYDTAALRLGDEIEIAVASIIPCDCYILDGDSLVDQSTMTGESVPLRKKSGDFLMSGTQNLSSSLVAVVCKTQEGSALESLISNISTSTENSTLDARAEKMISRFVSIILFLALFAFGSTWTTNWRAETGAILAFNVACERAMAVLASACPCALGLATPSAVMAGLDACRLRGVVIKKGLDTFQSISNLTHVVLDKTGTLTTGKLSVTNVEGGFDEKRLMLVCVAEREAAQYHPAAQAIFRWAFSSMSEMQRCSVGQTSAIATHNAAGNGIEVSVRPTLVGRYVKVHIGSERFMLQNGIEIPRRQLPYSKEGNSIFVHFAVDSQYIGTVRLQDSVRVEAKSVVEYLSRELHLNVSLLTGDAESEAQRVSRELDIPTLASHSLPAEKKSFVQAIQGLDSNHCVAMVGDGLNDSPALVAANVGICLSTNGLGRASVSESTNSQISDVVITSPNLCRLPEVMQIAQKTLKQSQWNMKWAISYNAFAVALALGASEPLGLKFDAARAGTMMAMSSISVLAWSLWLRYDLSKVSFQRSKMK